MRELEEAPRGQRRDDADQRPEHEQHQELAIDHRLGGIRLWGAHRARTLGHAAPGSPRPNRVIAAAGSIGDPSSMPLSVAPRRAATLVGRALRAAAAVRGSLWIVPLAGAIVGPLLSEVVLQFDARVEMPDAWSYSESTASVILGAIVSALVALTGFVVAFGVLVVQMATQTLSPRFMRLWYRDALQKALLGTFVGTLTFSLALLRGVSDTSVPDAGVTLAGAPSRSASCSS